MHPLLRKILDLFTPRGVLKSEKKGIIMMIIIIIIKKICLLHLIISKPLLSVLDLTLLARANSILPILLGALDISLQISILVFERTEMLYNPCFFNSIVTTVPYLLHLVVSTLPVPQHHTALRQVLPKPLGLLVE